MPTYSEIGNYSPVLFESKMCNCFKFFNDAYLNLEHLLDIYIKTKRMDAGSGAGELLKEIRKGFTAAYIILDDDDRYAAEYKSLFAQYAFIGSLLEDPSYAARFFDHRWADRKAMQPRQMDFYMRLSKAAVRAGDMLSVPEEEVPVVGNLAMFAAMSRGLVTCESQDYLQLTPQDFLLRFIVAAAHDGSPLLGELGAFSWLNLPENLILRRPMIFFPAISAACNELDVGKRYVLKVILNYFKDYAPDENTSAYFRLGYKCYNQLYEETAHILDDKAREFELYYLYGGSREDLPPTWHFKRLSFENSPPGEFIAANFKKNEFSRSETDMMERIFKNSGSGFLGALIDQLYYFNPQKNFRGTRKVKFVFKNYPRVIYADFVQYSENAVNCFWLPEAPEKVLDAADDAEFYMADKVKKLKTSSMPLKFSMEDGGPDTLEEPFKGLFMYGYGSRLLDFNFTQEFFSDNPAFGSFIRYLRNLPKDMAKKCALRLLKFNAFMRKEDLDLALNQLVYVSASAETLKSVVSQGAVAGKHIKYLLDVMDIPQKELLDVLGEREFGKLITSLIDWESGSIHYSKVVAEALEYLLISGKRFLNNDEALYLSTSYFLYNFRTTGTFDTLAAASRLLLSGDGQKSGLTPDMTIRFLQLYLNAKVDAGRVDGDFTDAYRQLWELSKARGSHKDEACAVLFKLLSAGHGEGYDEFLPYCEVITKEGQYQSCIIKEFILHQKIEANIRITEDEAEQMSKLYQAQGIITARTKTVADALFPREKWFQEGLAAFEWIKTEAGCQNITISETAYGDYAGGEVSEITDLDGMSGDVTCVCRVGFSNVFTVSYERNGQKTIKTVRRSMTKKPWIRGIIFSNAREFIAGTADANDGFLLLAGRMCAEEGYFEPDILFEYANYLSEIPLMRDEYARAAQFILSKRNDITKACLFTVEPTALLGRMKRFFTETLSRWRDINGKTGVKDLFTYIKCLERIAGPEKMGGLYNYLSDYATYSPEVKADLAESLNP